MISRSIIITLLSFVLFLPLFAEEIPLPEKLGEKKPENATNSIISFINSDSVLISGDEDTLFIQTTEGDSLNLPLKESSLKDDLFDMLYGAIFRDSTNTTYDTESNLTESEEKFLPYKGHLIKNIYISKVPVFGGSVDDTLEFTVTSIERFGNSLHVNTKDWVIHNNILFKVGDVIQPYELADNERILRRLPFIRDARILVVPTTEEEEVNLLIITRDVFSLGINVNARKIDDIAISLFERNLFGNGWEFRNTFRHRSEFDQEIDYEGIFNINNISGTFIGITLQYIYAHDLEQGWVKFNKEYLTPETQYAGGIDLIRTTSKNELEDFYRDAGWRRMPVGQRREYRGELS